MADPVIAVYTHTGLLSANLIQAWVAAAQVAITGDFAPHWGNAVLRYVPPGGAIDADEWQLVFFDHSDQAQALGYHNVTAAGLPILKVFIADCLADAANWNVTALHEVYEAIADPFIDRTVTFGGWEYALEVADAPEDDQYAVRIAGHMASNAVTPAWFKPDGVAPFTIYPCASITKPFELAPGGYIGRRQLPDGQWEQQLGVGARSARQVKRPTSRTMRRFGA